MDRREIGIICNNIDPIRRCIYAELGEYDLTRINSLNAMLVDIW